MKIVVTIRPTAVVGRNRAARQLKRALASGQAANVLPLSTATPKLRPRFAAEWVGGPHHGERVEGFHTPDEAVGALIASAAEHYATHDEVLAFLASLFSSHPLRRAAVELARAVRFSNRNPKRHHAGCYVQLPDTAPASPAPTSAPAMRQEGGVA